MQVSSKLDTVTFQVLRGKEEIFVASIPREGQQAPKDNLGQTSKQDSHSMSSGGANVDLVVTKSVVAKLSIVVHNLILGVNDLRVVLKVQISSNEAAVQFDNLGDLKFAMCWLVQTAGSLNNLQWEEQGGTMLGFSHQTTGLGGTWTRLPLC